MKICPRARLDDSLLDLVIVEGMSPGRALRLFPLVYLGWHVRRREVKMLRTPWARVRFDAEQKLVADGEGVGRASLEARFEVVSGALQVAAEATRP